MGWVQGYEMEADAFAELALTKESSGLRSLFFGQVILKFQAVNKKDFTKFSRHLLRKIHSLEQWK